MKYTATIRHHSIHAARSVEAPTLTAVKRKASLEFGKELGEYVIVVLKHQDGAWPPEIVASRRVDSPRWITVVPQSLGRAHRSGKRS